MDPAAWPVLLVAHRDALRMTMAREAGAHGIDPSAAGPPGSLVGHCRNEPSLGLIGQEQWLLGETMEHW